MKDYGEFRDKLCRGQVCLGTCITFNDPTVTEALCIPTIVNRRTPAEFTLRWLTQSETRPFA